MSLRYHLFVGLVVGLLMSFVAGSIVGALCWSFGEPYGPVVWVVLGCLVVYPLIGAGVWAADRMGVRWDADESCGNPRSASPLPGVSGVGLGGDAVRGVRGLLGGVFTQFGAPTGVGPVAGGVRESGTGGGGVMTDLDHMRYSQAITIPLHPIPEKLKRLPYNSLFWGRLHLERFSDGHFRVEWRKGDGSSMTSAELVVKVRAACVVFWPAHTGVLADRAGNKDSHGSDGWGIARGSLRFAVPNLELVALAKGCCEAGQPGPLVDWLLENDSHPVLRAIVADFQAEFGEK